MSDTSTKNNISDIKYVKLKDVLNYTQPTNYIVKSTEYQDSYKIPVLTPGSTFILGYTDENFGIYQACPKTPIILFDDFTTSFHWVDFDFKIKSSAAKIITLKNNIARFRYIFYVMKNINLQLIGHRRRWIREYSEIEIPLPSLSVQDEIISFLDEYYNLNKDLINSIEMEKKYRIDQYNFYKKEAFKLDNPNIMPLSDFAEIGTGNSNTNEEVKKGKYPFFVRSQRVRFKNNYEFDETAIITSGDGAGVGKIFHYIEGKYALHQRAYRIKILDDSILPIYFFHYFKTTFLDYIEKVSFKSSVTSIRLPMLQNFEVPIPSLDMQREIIIYLNSLDEYFESLIELLDEEILFRKNQFKYVCKNSLELNE